MILGVVSDTHGYLPTTQAAVRMLESLHVEAVLHCGDIGGPEIPAYFQAWPTHFVFGNCDFNLTELKRSIEALGLTCHGRFGDIMLAGRRIALIHSDDHTLFARTIESGLYDMVCYGHTHQAKVQQVGKTLVLNPGALYRANPPTIAIIDLATLVVTNIRVE